MHNEQVRVLCLGHRFEDLAIEQEVLGRVAAVVDGNRLTPAQQETALEEAHGILLGTAASLGSPRISRMRHCRVIARYGVGVDNVAIAEAQARGIVVTNVPDYCVDEVSDHALTLILCVARQILPALEAVRQGRWDLQPVAPVRRLSSLTMGLVGVGQIGQALGRKAAALGMRVLAFDPWADPEAFVRAVAVSVEFPILLGESDFISIHCPLTLETRGLFGAVQFRQMKPTAWLVNTSRGEVVDEDALLRALDAGEIAGAALDVVAGEPPPAGHPMRQRQDVVLTPHVAWFSKEAIEELRRKAAEQVRDVLVGRWPPYALTPKPPAAGTGDDGT